MNVEELIVETFKKAKNMAIESDKSILDTKKTPRLIYPLIRSQESSNGKEKTQKRCFRLSEQEIKQLFIETLIEDKKNDFYFSVETPTKFRYKFSAQGENGKRHNIKPLVKEGESANIDLCLHKIENSIFSRKHLIEFKAKNPNPKNYEKDFLKLLAEKEDLSNYFVHILDSANDKTLNSLCAKYNNSFQYCIKECKSKKIATKNTIVVYTFIIVNQTKNQSSGYYKIVLNPTQFQSLKDFQLGDFTIID